MTALPVSVIVVSRGRPELLPRCLTGIGQLCYPTFEIIVVADPAGMAAIERDWGNRAKLVPFDEANISAARNAGIVQAAGEVVAFIDDDAVPEPTWLAQLTAPFSDPGIAATGGYVIGRNGISFQWTARAVNAYGEKILLDHAGDEPFEPVPPAGFVTKLEGTNCAFRRSTLADLGGFDPAFRYYLDETDVNMRLAQAGARTVIVPRALVHHGYAASARRAADRAPRDLTEVGASSALFLRKHAPGADLSAQRLAQFAAHRAALLRHMVAGSLEPRDVGRILKSFRTGFAEGRRRTLDLLAPLVSEDTPMRTFRRTPASGHSRYFAGRMWSRASLRRKAAKAVADGDIVTLFRFSPTALPHRVRFHEDGWWEQSGGLFGRSVRDAGLPSLQGFRNRVRKEWARVALLRSCGDTTRIPG
jgi:GT2 family glycosyltransferase